MDFSLWPAASRTWREVLEGAEYAERTGWHGVWVADHFMQNGDDLSVPVNECLALLAGIVNHWGNPKLAAHKGEVFARHCEKIGRDPKSVRRSAQTMLEVVVPGDTEAIERKERLESRGGHVIMGSAQEVLDTVAQYPAAGIDELLVPDSFLGTGNRRFEALERLREEVLAKL
ncbi:hypothetical protein AB0H36_41115 [Kribbella sp. NPDC050820]|uniref:hypothetical protein n=1 Tax=Kribbella sp. NPDC050820 TaxID=3155408 RepID=UPI0033D96E1D